VGSIVQRNLLDPYFRFYCILLTLIWQNRVGSTVKRNPLNPYFRFYIINPNIAEQNGLYRPNESPLHYLGVYIINPNMAEQSGSTVQRNLLDPYFRFYCILLTLMWQNRVGTTVQRNLLDPYFRFYCILLTLIWQNRVGTIPSKGIYLTLIIGSILLTLIWQNRVGSIVQRYLLNPYFRFYIINPNMAEQSGLYRPKVSP